MPLVVDTPLVWLNRFVDKHVMDARQAACRRRPRETVLKVSGESSSVQDATISPVTNS